MAERMTAHACKHRHMHTLAHIHLHTYIMSRLQLSEHNLTPSGAEVQLLYRVFNVALQLPRLVALNWVSDCVWYTAKDWKGSSCQLCEGIVLAFTRRD